VAALAAALYLFWPRLAALWTQLPLVLAAVAGGAAAVVVLWYLLLVASFYSRVNLLPERLLERGPFLRLMNWTSLLSRVVGRRDWVEHAAIDVYNTLAIRRGRKVGKGELLVLIRAASRRRRWTVCWGLRGATTCRCSSPRAASWRGG